MNFARFSKAIAAALTSITGAIAAAVTYGLVNGHGAQVALFVIAVVTAVLTPLGVVIAPPNSLTAPPVPPPGAASAADPEGVGAAAPPAPAPTSVGAVAPPLPEPPALTS